jgi:4-aminobutyrate aminotransferase-like enzyme
MIAVEFLFSNEPERVMKIVDMMRNEGILVLLCGHKGQYIRILPPLNVSLNEVDIFLSKFHEIVGRV